MLCTPTQQPQQFPQHSYKILCHKKIVEPCKPEKSAEIILDHIALPEDQFRLGNSKVESYESYVRHVSWFCVHTNLYCNIANLYVRYMNDVLESK